MSLHLPRLSLSLPKSYYKDRLQQFIWKSPQAPIMGVGLDTATIDVTRITLTRATSLEGESDAADYRAPNLIRRILSLFKDIRPGSDLSHFRVPPQFNMPKSQLQCYGESIYCFNGDMLSKCSTEESALERFKAVVGWNISTFRPPIFGISPYNPILGETHHVSRGSLHVFLEQVSHHPPVTALHATDEKENLEIIACQFPSARFYGTSVEVEVCGKRHLKILNHGETYTMNSPKLMFKFLPSTAAEWGGVVNIECHESGLKAELHIKGLSFLGCKSNARSIKGNIFDSSSLKPLYEINGHWDRTVTLKDIHSGEVTVMYNAKEIISGLKSPVVYDSKGVWTSESASVWSEVSQGILSKDWEKAKRAKRSIEEKQRELARERESRKEQWISKHFILTHNKESHNKESGWNCLPIQKSVPPASIRIPL